MLRHVQTSAIFVSVIYFASAAFAEAPSLEEIQSRLQDNLPSYWQIVDHRIVAEVNRGDAVDPLWAQRQEIDVIVNEPLYVLDQYGPNLGPFDILIEVTPEETERTLYLVSTAEREKGQWSFTFDFENGVEQLGLPQDLFNTPTLVLGSDGYRQAVETISEAARAQFLAERRAAIAEIEAESAAMVAIARAELDRQRIALRADRDAVLQELEARVVAAQSDLDARLAEIAAETQARIAEAEQAAEREITAARTATALFTELNAALADRQAAERDAARARSDLYVSVRDDSEAFARVVLEDLASEDIARRVAAFDAALAAGDGFARNQAVRAAFSSGDTDLQAHALTQDAVYATPDLALAAMRAVLAANDLDAVLQLLDRVEPGSPAGVAMVELAIADLDATNAVTLLPQLIAAGGSESIAQMSSLTDAFGAVVATTRTKLFDSWPSDARSSGLDDKGRLFSEALGGAKTLLSHPPDQSTASGYLVETYGLPLAITVRSHERGNGTFAVFSDGQEIYRENIDDNDFVRRVVDIPAGAKTVELRHIPDEWSWEHLYFTEMGPAFQQ